MHGPHPTPGTPEPSQRWEPTFPRPLSFVVGVRRRVQGDPQQLGGFFCISRIVSACSSRCRRRAFSLRSCSFSTVTGSRPRPLGPRGLASAFSDPFSPSAPPFRQVRRIQPLAAQQRRDLARLLAPICLFQNTEFVLGSELPALGLFRYFWVRASSSLPLLVLIISNSPLRPVNYSKLGRGGVSP